MAIFDRTDEELGRMLRKIAEACEASSTDEIATMGACLLLVNALMENNAEKGVFHIGSVTIEDNEENPTNWKITVEQESPS